MCNKDVVKARIRKLEGDLSGLLYRLSLLCKTPVFSQKTITSTFNTSTIREQIEMSISSIRQELCGLQQDEQDYGFIYAQDALPHLTLAA